MNFKYRAKTPTGEMVEGFAEADDKREALNSLRERGMVVVSLDAQSMTGGNGKFAWKKLLNMDLGAIVGGGKVPGKNLMVFFRQLATMETAGLGLSTAINVIGDQEKNYALKKTLDNIKARIDRGTPLSQAMAAQRAFSPLVVSLVEAGEEGGMLGSALEQCATLLEKQESLKSKIRGAMFYPAFVMTFAIAVLIVFFVYLVPKFKEVFATLNIELPAVTQTMFALGDWFQEYWYLPVGAIFILVFSWRILSTNKLTMGIMDRIKLKLPVIKTLIMKSSMARSTRTFAALTSAGVPVMRGLEMAEGTAGNLAIKKGFADLRNGVERGVSLGDSAKQAGIFPVLVSQMMRIGEETGHLDSMLERVAGWYDQELDDQIKSTVSLLEPAMIIFVGGIIAIIAISIFAPITSSIMQMA